ncbi:hypothetical protein AB3X93_20390, partial [Paraburkholderia sp. BR14262]|uniref:hypothetical protein n=1 Tax=Paraburkholderia sp. BR14262 TaxID=3236999 RepID=UPI0034CD1B76
REGAEARCADPEAIMKQPETPDDDGPNVKSPQHDGSEPLARRPPHEPRSGGRQGPSDGASGQAAPDRRGGDAYQERTQNDEPVNRNSREGRR